MAANKLPESFWRILDVREVDQLQGGSVFEKLLEINQVEINIVLIDLWKKNLFTSIKIVQHKTKQITKLIQTQKC